MSNQEADLTLDLRLCDVPVPERLLRRLRDVAGWSDTEVDLRLCDVEIPDGLLTRFLAIPDDEQLDEWIRSLPVSVQVIPRARTITYLRRRSLVGRLALAASLMLIVGAGLAGAGAGWLVTVYPPEKETITLAVVDRGPLEISSDADQSVAIVPLMSPDLNSGTGFGLAANQTELGLVPILDRVPPGPAGQLFAEIPDVWRPMDNWLLLRWGVLGYSQQPIDALPELAAVAAPISRGAEAPLLRGFDRELLFSQGVNPPVLVSADPSAGSVRVSLTSDTTSFEAARRSVAEGRWPERELVRVEDFLAAMDYRFPAADPGTLAIRTAAGPSVFNPSAAGLVQVGVKAGRGPQRQLPATHLTIALDISGAMNWDGRLDQSRQAIRRFLPYLEPQDRLSLIVFADDAVKIVHEAQVPESRRVADLLDGLSGAGGANLSAGLQQAISASLEAEAGPDVARRLVLITANQPSLSEASRLALRHTFEEAAKLDFQFAIFPMGGSHEKADAWADIAGNASWSARQIQSAEQLRWALVETLTGASSLTATQTKLHVNFNPKAVAAYRLIGHEATGYGGLLAGAVESDVHVDEETSVLFEVWLHPNDEENIGQVTLEWTEAATGQARRAGPQRISRLQFATDFEGSPISLQAAALGGETAEILRQGYNFSLVSPQIYHYQPKPRKLEDVQALSRRANAALEARPEFQRLVELVDAASRLPAPANPLAARSGTRGIVSGEWRELRE